MRMRSVFATDLFQPASFTPARLREGRSTAPLTEPFLRRHKKITIKKRNIIDFKLFFIYVCIKFFNQIFLVFALPRAGEVLGGAQTRPRDGKQRQAEKAGSGKAGSGKYEKQR
jgi:hypothetical protein